MASSPPPPTVAIIGAGPGGMFFCHALETMKQKLMDEGDEAAVANLPIVTCFERADGPGGVWRSTRTFAAATADSEEKKTSDVSPRSAASYTYDEPATTTTNMCKLLKSCMLAVHETFDRLTLIMLPPNIIYVDEALWTNGPKEAIEFYDYHFDQHFDYPLPVYMPRQPVLDYMIGRITRKCPDFFEKYMKFNTSVEYVTYMEETSKFEVVTRDMISGEEVTQQFDKCIWAGGENGRPKMPQAMLDMFHDGNFHGKIVHSSDTSDFENDVRGKRVLLIGGGYSAEDLALMAVKCGVEKVYISSRQHENVISWTGAWPGNKVEVLEAQTPVGVTEDGNCIQFAKTWWQWPDKYLPYNKVETEIRDIDTIIMCTGYQPNFQMLDESLREAVKKTAERKVPVRSDWKMKPNKVTELLGDMEVGDVRWINSVVGYPGLYRGLSIDNPNMMFIVTSVDNPLFGIDVDSWLLLRFITGLNKIPSAEEMWKQNEDDAWRQMDNIYLRYCMDSAYCKAYDAMHYKDPACRDLLWGSYKEAKSKHYEIYYRILARSIQEAEYPVSYGSYDELNEIVQTLIKYGTMSYYARYNLRPDDKDSEWKTFRDCSNSDKFRSVFTGAKSVPLKQRWLDIDANDATVLEP